MIFRRMEKGYKFHRGSRPILRISHHPPFSTQGHIENRGSRRPMYRYGCADVECLTPSQLCCILGSMSPKTPLPFLSFARFTSFCLSGKTTLKTKTVLRPTSKTFVHSNTNTRKSASVWNLPGSITSGSVIICTEKNRFRSLSKPLSTSNAPFD